MHEISQKISARCEFPSQQDWNKIPDPARSAAPMAGKLVPAENGMYPSGSSSLGFIPAETINIGRADPALKNRVNFLPGLQYWLGLIMPVPSVHLNRVNYLPDFSIRFTAENV